MHESFILADALALAKVGTSGLMQTHHRVDAAAQKSGYRFEGAEASVGQKHIAFLEEIPPLAKQSILMILHRPFDPLGERAAA